MSRPLLDPEQIDGAKFLAHRPVAMLADAPGVGKSGQIVRACEFVGAERITGVIPNRTLARNMAREFSKWGYVGWPVQILKTGRDEVAPHGVSLVTYALARNPRIRKLLRHRGNDVLFCDEAHRLKEGDAQQTTAILSEKGKDGGAGIARGARHTWLATGTPVPNHAGELFVFARVAGVYTGNFASWVNRFCVEVQGDGGPKIVGSKNFDELRALLAPVYLRRENRSVQAPRISHLVVEADCDPYAELWPQDRARIEAAIAAGDMSFADTPAMASVRRLVGLAKVPGVIDIAESDLNGGYFKVLIFCQHTDVIRLIAKGLEQYGAAIFDGKMTDRQKEHAIRTFNDDPLQRVRVIQMKAGGEGLDEFKIANRVIIAEPSWTPIENEQAIRRAARRGQLADFVDASYVALADSMDEQVVAVNARKSKDIAQII